MENPTDDHSNADLPSDSEIVITCPAFGEGGGRENSTRVTVKTVTVVEDAIAPDPWEEEYTLVNVDADGWGEVVRVQSPASPVENAPEAAEVHTHDQTDKTPQPLQQDTVETATQVEEEMQLHTFKFGDRVFVNSCPHTDKCGPYSVEKIDGEFARLEMFSKPVRLSDLRKVE